MTEQLDQALKRLVKESRADAALVWSRSGPTGGAFVLSGYPVGIPSGPIPRFVPDDIATGAIEHNPDRLSERLPESMVLVLPTPPAVARSFSLGEDLRLTVAWCDRAASAELTEERQRQAIDDIGALAQLSWDLHVTEVDAEGLRAIVNGLGDASSPSIPGWAGWPSTRRPRRCWASPRAESGTTRAESRRHRFLHQHRQVRPDGLRRVRVALRRSDHARLPAVPAGLQCMRGSRLVVEDLGAAPEVLALNGFRHHHDMAGRTGRITDFVYRDVNRATCEYLGMARDQLIGRTSAVPTATPMASPSPAVSSMTKSGSPRRPRIRGGCRMNRMPGTGV